MNLILPLSAHTGAEIYEVRRSGEGSHLYRWREMLCYVGRHHGRVSMAELAKFLRVKEASTPKLTVRRAEERLKAVTNFRRLLDRAMETLD